MSSPFGGGDGIVRRLNFGVHEGPSSPFGGGTLSARRGVHSGPRPSPPCSARTPLGAVRYGLPEEELQHYASHRSASASQRSVSYRVPDDDDDLADDDDATSAPAAAAVTRVDAVEEHRRLVEQQLVASLQSRHHVRQASWQTQLADLEAQLASKMSTLAGSAARKQNDLLREDQEALAAAAARRDEVLRAVQRSHRTEASLQEQQIRRLVEQREEERRKEEERKRREEEEARRQRETEERRRQEAAAAAAERKAKEEAEQRRKAAEEAEAAKRRQEEEAAAKKEQQAAGPKAHPCLRVTPAAAQAAASLAARLAEMEAAAAPLRADEGLKKQRRDIEKSLTKYVVQVSATQAQVRAKCGDVYALLSPLSGPWRAFAVTTLAGKLLKQQELVQLNNKAAFPLALVAVALAAHFPELLDALVALLHRECTLAVPRSYLHDAQRITNNAYYRGMGFAELDDPAAPSGKVFESPDDYSKRLEGLMLLYGAVMQVDDPNPHGIAHAWAWCARALNTLPPDRYAARALICVLRVAGYAMGVRYRGQFVKLLGALQREFLPALRASKDEDVGALAALLEAYVADGAWRRPPEGRNLPLDDVSQRQECRA